MQALHQSTTKRESRANQPRYSQKQPTPYTKMPLQHTPATTHATDAVTVTLTENAQQSDKDATTAMV